ncbi:RNA polymerase sigma factor (sigma-70 family) [Ereboglobus sp. PH5-10]|nr:RNA polymerase sigma factor [Ereboglobus sp. PH5-10]MDF9827679.1 RNA polymerase sigma factor (sigma-70 family) [Ereboglobus sp. PH5-10]
MTVTVSINIFLPTPLNTEIPAPARAGSDNAAANTAPGDHALMLAVRDGDIDRLGELFERHHRRLYAFCAQLTRQPAAAEDIVQNVFHRILKYRHTYRDNGNFTAWMYHLARNCAADFFQKQSTAPVPVDPGDLHAHASSESPPDARAAQTDDLALLRAALDRLPVEHREIIVLSRLQNLGHREAARILDCSVGAAKVRAHRALKALRETYLALRQNPQPL